MNSRTWLLGPLLVAAPAAIAQIETATPPPPPVVQALPRGASPIPQPGTQQVYGPSGDTLIAREAADGVLEGFRKIYVRDGAPRVVIYVNRALVDTGAAKSGGETEPSLPAETQPATDANRAPEAPGPAAPALADRQTVREIERLFGRAFRHAGAQLADYAVAASLLPDQPGTRLASAQAAKERQALANVADIAIEVLISSRNLVVPEVSGDVTYAVPDIQATAIRLKDAAIVGQAAASDILGKGVQAGRIVRQFDVRDITEATAIALMEDMLIGRE